MGAIYLISIRFHKGVQEFFSADRCDDIPSCFPSPKDYNRLLPFLLPSFPPTFSSSSSLDHNQRALQIPSKLSSPRNNQTHKAPEKEPREIRNDGTTCCRYRSSAASAFDGSRPNPAVWLVRWVSIPLLTISSYNLINEDEIFRHLTLLLTTFRYAIAAVKFSTNSTSASIAYRIGFLSAAVTYGIVVYKAYRPRIRAGQVPTGQQGILKVLADENVQYLCKLFTPLFSSSQDSYLKESWMKFGYKR